MTTRAAVNILGSTGAVMDITSLGVDTITTEHPGLGQYLVHGTLGMARPPEGWGYVLNQIDAACSVAIGYTDGVLAVSVAKDGEPVDLAHSITLHVSVNSRPPQEIPPPDPLPVIDPVELAQAEISRLRAVADYAIAPLQDAVDLGISTPEKVELLKSWKKYRMTIYDVPNQQGFPEGIIWPSAPSVTS